MDLEPGEEGERGWTLTASDFLDDSVESEIDSVP